ncbi:hypothetical protein GHK50_29800 [Sinorhizobium medicae]|uniref:Uncharacterized protein n=1 Tax=Sinorhizobium medicae TaxID=110321 RepID=A0A6G1WDX4_9HYPH|nr:hypothetical protein [Sinorhizobium medicae]MDX0622434.1 hypothetical protein [Sinorhizobium medicae]MQW67873.1 hypothetical protein [Sinorhizobium medicae]MQX87072.1 hypothetical protein [Sinorhizobium medicae]
MKDDKEPKDQRIPIMMTASEVRQIDDWSFAQRIRSRGEAIRRLCHIGLNAEEKLDMVAELIQVASEWTDETRRHQLEDSNGSDPDAPAPLATQTNFIGSMVLLAAKIAMHEMRSKGENLRELEDIKVALEASIDDDPQMAEAREKLELFIDDWKARLPGKAMRPAKARE